MKKTPIMLNVDGSSLLSIDHRRTIYWATGGVIRNNQREWVIGYVKFIGMGTVERVEA